MQCFLTLFPSKYAIKEGKDSDVFSGEIMTKFYLSIFAAFALIFSSCSKSEHRVVLNEEEELIRLQTELAERGEIKIVDESGVAISDAEVLIGTSEGVPFPNNLVKTNSKGNFVVPTLWTQTLPVTIFKDGYVKTSYLHQKPQGQIFEVKRKKTIIRHEVKGSITGFGNLPNDGFIDFGLAITSFNNVSALNFDIAQMISEEHDTISVMGQKLDIPTNIFVPKQKESYGIIPLTVEKAFYRLFYDFVGTYSIQASLGRFDFKKVSKKIQDGLSYFEVVNDFQFTSIGTKALLVDNQNVKFDIAANIKKLTPKIDFGLKAPSTGMLFAVSMYEHNGNLIANDIKLREGNLPQKLALPEDISEGTVLLVHADKVQVTKEIAALSPSMSTALVPSLQIDKGVLLDRIDPPTMTAEGIKLNKPNLKANLKGYATYAALSDTSREDFKRFSLERADVSWEIYSPGWIDHIDLPEVLSVRSNQRWEIVFYGVDSNKFFNGPRTLNQATHAVHNAINF